jgi:hypothetical protein
VAPANASAPTVSGASRIAALPSGSSSGTSSSSAPAGSGDGSASGSSGSSAAKSAGVDHFHSSRSWIGASGTKNRRTTILTFVLQQAGPVVFTVNELSPACVGVGRFTVNGHAGVNHVRFGGVVDNRQLAPGTYRLSIRTAAGAVVRRVKLVVVDGPAPSHDELHALRAANTCRGAGATASAAAGTATSAEAGAAPATTHQLTRLPTAPTPQAAAAGLAPRAPNLHSGVLATSVEKTARAIEPLLVALLAASIVLLGLASLPREAVPGPRMHDVLARHRLGLAVLGTAALVAVALAFLVT